MPSSRHGPRTRATIVPGGAGTGSPATPLLAVLSALVLAACTNPPPGDVAPTPQPPADSATEDPSDPGSAGPDTGRSTPPDDGDVEASPPEADRSAPEDAQPADCTDEQLAAIENTVDAQLAAMADGDWDTALSYTSSSFQDGIDADGLAEIISEGFPVVADNVEHTLGACVRAGADAQVLVTVADDAGDTQQLVYVLEREPAGWRVAAATPHGGDQDEPDTAIV